MRTTELTLSLTANDRPEYLGKVLASWREVDGVEELTAVFNVEPGNEMVRSMCEGADFFGQNITIVNRHRYGALTNPWYALRRGFRFSDFVIVGEDDSVVSSDVLSYFDWGREQMEDAPHVFAVNAFRWRYPVQSSSEAAEHLSSVRWCGVVGMDRFYPTIWGTNVTVWRERIRDTWDFLYRFKGWDWNFAERIAPGQTCLTPWVSRSQHIGKYGGVHMPEDQFEEFQSDCFLADPPRGPFTFRG